MSDRLAEDILRYAEICARGTGVVPAGDVAWKLRQIVNAHDEGSPISPVFPSAEALAEWMSDTERGDQWVPYPTARAFVEAGWAPSGVISAEMGVQHGVEYVGLNMDGAGISTTEED